MVLPGGLYKLYGVTDINDVAGKDFGFESVTFVGEELAQFAPANGSQRV